MPLQHNLRHGNKKKLVPLDGFCIVDFKYIDKFYDILFELNELLKSNKADKLFDVRCNCKNPKLKGYNGQTHAWTMICDVACQCGTVYMKFMFGNIINRILNN